MPKKILEDSDSDIEIKIDNEYAKSYNTWRQKEELNKLKTKYGDEALQTLEDSSSSEEEDEEGDEITEEVEKEFFKTLSALKNKDPRIYDSSTTFFHDEPSESKLKKRKSKMEKPLFVKDYERKLILEKGADFSDDSDLEANEKCKESLTYVEEQQEIKQNLKKALEEVDDEEGDDWGGMLKARKKSADEKSKEETDFKEWLAGQKNELSNKDVEADLKPLRDYWTNPDLDKGEKFLRDYILKKRFLNKDDEDYIPTYEEIVHDSDKDLSEDEDTLTKQEEFEHKYNFRFEEPDQEFIKRYPRTVENSLRTTNNKRIVKRAEIKERKQQEKEQKMQDLKKLQDLKRREIEDKMEKLREITGNSEIAFDDNDVDGDFDPEEHDKRMEKLFSDEFYQGEENDQKPEFPELDEYLELENWEKWKGEDDDEGKEAALHCEDDDFNMDADYDPQTSLKNELVDNSRGRKKRKRKSLFAKAVSQPKPVFDPKDKTYEEYLDEYYKLDCEDIIGDVPCRFKYRKVVPNTFGLTVEEILKANDRELNRWCSLKKAVQHRPDNVEKYDQIAYARKATNVELKRKILPSLFEDENKSDGNKKGITSTNNRPDKIEATSVSKDELDEPDNLKQTTEKVDKDETNINITKTESKSKKRKSKKKQEPKNNGESKMSKKRKLSEGLSEKTAPVDKQKFKKKVKAVSKNEKIGLSDARLSAYGINPKKFKNKLRYGKSN